MISEMEDVAYLGKLGGALAKAQGEIRPASLDKTNSHFKSKYASLASVWESCRDALAKNGLSITQTYAKLPDGQWVLVTRLIHSSGESVSGSFPILLAPGAGIQQFCSAASYARRYGLSSIVGLVSDDDDDGNGANTHSPGPAQNTRQEFKKAPPANPQTSPIKVPPAQGKPITFGKFKGMTLNQVPPGELENYAAYLMKSDDIKPFVKEFIEDVQKYLAGVTKEVAKSMPQREAGDPGPDFAGDDGVPF